jgi:hypothetical protein
VSTLWHWLGADDGGGHIYLLLSGLIASAGVLATPLVLLRRHKCEVHRCWRLGRHVTGGGHSVCRYHHPDAAPTAHEVKMAHFDAKRPMLIAPPRGGKTW